MRHKQHALDFDEGPGTQSKGLHMDKKDCLYS